jgi:hypothetical protein
MIRRVEYEQLVYTLPASYPSIHLSTLVIVPPGMDTAHLSGLVLFGTDIVLCVHEVLDFQRGVIEAYGYEVSQSHSSFMATPIPDAAEYCRASYPNKDKLYWYDSWPHPGNPTLAATHPHHKHVHPNIKRNRIPAPGLSFTQPNLPFLIEEIERELLKGRVP